MSEEFEEITVKVPKGMLENLEFLDENNNEHIREDMLQRLRWDDKKIFFGDLFRYGGEKVKEDGATNFLDWVREERIPIFKDQDKKEEAEEIFKKMYIQ